MKRYIHEVEQPSTFDSLNPIEAMAIINPKMCKNLTIQVEVEQRDEGPIPHMHIYHDKTRDPKKCSYVRLDEPSYSTHHSDNVPLPPNLKKQFIKVMTSPWPKQIIQTPTGYRPATGYEAAVDTWVDTFEGEGDYSKFNLDENGNLIPVDYSNL